MKIVDTQGRQLISAGAATFGGLLQFTGTNHAGIQLNSLPSAQRDALAAAAGMLLLNSDENALNYYSLDIDSVASGWLGVPKNSIEDSKRVFMSRLPNVATAITLVSDKAYFVYLGRTTKPLKVKH